MEDSMKKIMVLNFVTFSMMTISLAKAAEISATYNKSKQVSITLDSKNIPRVDFDKKSRPTIKDFGEDSEYADVCYRGEIDEVKLLLTGLVNAADGDGDTFSTLNSIKSNKDLLLTVNTTIESESGSEDISYKFSPCEPKEFSKDFRCVEIGKNKNDYISMTIGFKNGKSPEILSARWLERNKDSVQPLFFSLPEINVAPYSKVGDKEIKYEIPSDNKDRLNLKIISTQKALAKRSEFIIKASTENGHGVTYVSEHTFQCKKSVD